MIKNKTIICDLDGTLCNTDHRKHFMEQKPKDWNSFYAGIPNDTINRWCYDILWRFNSGKAVNCMDVILVSGRPEKYRSVTEEWLLKHDVLCSGLFMRKDGDFRDDAIVKKEIYEQHIEPFYDVLFCIDDRQRVVDMWREQGLVCLQCAKGDF